MLKGRQELSYGGQSFPTFSSVFTVFYQVHWEGHRFKKNVFAEKLGVHADTVSNWMNHATNRPSSEKIIEAGHILGLPPVAIDALLVIAGHNTLYGSSQEQAVGFARMVEGGGYSAFQRGATPVQATEPATQSLSAPTNRESRQTHIYAQRNAYTAQDNSTLQIHEGLSRLQWIIIGIVTLLIIGLIARLGYQKIQGNSGLEAIPAPPMSTLYVRDPLEPDVNEALDIADDMFIDQRVMEYKDKINYLSKASRNDIKLFYDAALTEHGWTIAKHEDLEYGLALAYGNPDDKWKVLVMYLDLRSYGRDDALILTLLAKKRGE